MTGLASAVSFLTVFPGRGRMGHSALYWFPVVGAGLGLLLGGIWYGTNLLWPPGVAAALVVGADIAGTGMLHMDGLVDSADGLLPPMSRQRRLAVMSDPHAGAFGLVAVVVVLMVRFSALIQIKPSLLILCGLWAASRGCAATAVNLVPYARDSGIANIFDSDGHAPVQGAGGLRGRLGGSALLPAITGLAIGALTMSLWHPLYGLAALAVSLGVFVLVMAFGYLRLGGFTGDVIGAAIVIAETAGLVMAAIK
ncbi:MAG: adenosylcobinamide-GDP ribazoletransferase [Acidimicrobiales bacterium]